MKKKKEVKPYLDADLCKWIQDGELYARDLLIRQNLKFIKKIAGSFVINPWIGLDRDDLVQIGSMAMMDAAKSYDPDRGAKFEMFMTPVLKNAMIDLIREHQNGFEYRAIDPEGTLNYQLLRIDDEIPNSNGQTVAEYVRDTDIIQPESREIRRESITEIHKALSAIPEAQRMYLCYRLGFREDGIPHSLEDIANTSVSPWDLQGHSRKKRWIMHCWNYHGGMRKQTGFPFGSFRNKYERKRTTRALLLRQDEGVIYHFAPPVM